MYWEHLHLNKYAAHYYKPRPYLTFMHVLHQHSVASDLTDHMTSIYLQILAVSLFCQFSAIVHSESTRFLFSHTWQTNKEPGLSTYQLYSAYSNKALN